MRDSIPPRSARLIALLACWAVSTAQAPPPPALTLDAAVARAIAANPSIAAARLARPVGTASLRVAGLRPNPALSTEAERETPHMAVAAAWPLETGDKRARRVDVAEAALATTDAEIARTIQDVRSDVRRAYFEAVAALERVRLGDELEGLARRATDAARERVDTGAAPRLELLQAQLALAQASNETAAARGDSMATRATLNALLAYAADAAPTLTDSLRSGRLASTADATRDALARSAELAVLEHRIAEARAQVALARALRRPDASIQTTLTYGAQPEFTVGWRAGVSVVLPLFNSGRAAVDVASATLAQVTAERDARAAAIAGTVAAAGARAEAARAALDRYDRDLLPASRQIEAMADESYRSGQTGVVSLLQALQGAREVRMRAAQAGLDYQVALADLERAMGMPLP